MRPFRAKIPRVIVAVAIGLNFAGCANVSEYRRAVECGRQLAQIYDAISKWIALKGPLVYRADGQLELTTLLSARGNDAGLQYACQIDLDGSHISTAGWLKTEELALGKEHREFIIAADDPASHPAGGEEFWLQVLWSDGDVETYRLSGADAKLVKQQLVGNERIWRESLKFTGNPSNFGGK